MKQFACGDVIPGCGAVFTERSDALVLAAVARHAAADHGVHEVSPELVATVTGAIRTVAVT
jgi:predicted small metal-binding protein